jgi:S1-C subfamily serine protease
VRAQLVHLTGPWRGRTWTYPDHELILGADPAADVRFPASTQVAPRHAEIVYSEPDCAFFLRAGDGPVFVNHRQVSEVQLVENDQIELGAGGPKLRFHLYVPPGAVCKPVRMMLADAGAAAEVGGVPAFTRTLTRDLLTHATWKLKLFFPLALFAVVMVVGWIAGWLGARAPVRELDARTKADAALVTRIHDVDARGVCLIHGVYGFRRHGDPQRLLLDGDGDRVEVEYTGSGFLVSADGAVVTNRHVVRPWLEGAQGQAFVRLGHEPIFFHFTVTFPGRAPVNVDPMLARVRSDDHDVAVFYAPSTSVQGVPVLALWARTPEPDRGQRVHVIGYPLGLRAILGKTDRALVQQLARADATQAEIIAGLAQADAIRPLVTQGVLCDVTSVNLVYDAGTTSGGSGGPVLCADGTVIGVNYAVMRGFDSSNFGVPIRFAQELLAEPRGSK